MICFIDRSTSRLTHFLFSFTDGKFCCYRQRFFPERRYSSPFFPRAPAYRVIPSLWVLAGPVDKVRPNIHLRKLGELKHQEKILTDQKNKVNYTKVKQDQFVKELLFKSSFHRKLPKNRVSI